MRKFKAKSRSGGTLRPAKVRRDERGAMMVLIALSLVGLMGMLVLSIDAGFAYRQRRFAQTAADAGAQAGAIEIFRAHPDSAVPAAFSETARNGFTDGVNNVVVIVNNPPATGPHAGDDKFVEVIVQQSLTTYFGRVVGRPILTVQPRSVAGVVQPANGCLYVLDPTADKALEIKSSGEIIGDECAVIVNSNDPDNAISVSNNGSGLAAVSIAVTGGAYVQSGSTAYITPSATEGVAASPDPLAGVTMPDVSGACNFTNITIVANQNLTPGVYCGGITVNVAGVTMDPGLYILKGGGLRVQTNAGDLTGTGVSFVNTNGPGNDADAFDILEIDSHGTVNLSAMTTGPLSGILFYQDPAAGKVGTLYVNKVHSGDPAQPSFITGTIYLPTQKIELAGSDGTLTIDGGVIAKTVLVQSDGTIHLGGGVAGGGVGAFTRATIVE